MRLMFDAQERADGTMLVKSPNLPIFCAVAKQGDWRTILDVAAQYIEINGSGTIQDASSEVPHDPNNSQRWRHPG